MPASAAAYRFAYTFGVGDPVIKAIDDLFGAGHRILDSLSGASDAADRVEQHAKAMKAKRDARTTSPNNVLLLERPQYRVEEVTDAESGEVSFDVVSTDGERVECSSRAAADKVCRALEASR